MRDMDRTNPNDLLYWAWTIIANVSEGNWDRQAEDWVTAAKDWRDAWHATIPAVEDPAHPDGQGADDGD